MKYQSLIRDFSCVCAVLAFCLAFSGCKKTAPEPQPAPEAPKADANAPKADANAPEAPKADANAPEAPKADAPQAKACAKWGNNAFFTDGSLVRYTLHSKIEACCNLDEDDPNWKCDKEGNCAQEENKDIECKVSLLETAPAYCISRITCNSTESKVPQSITMPFGIWGIDRSGVYHLEEDETPIELKKRSPAGNCGDSTESPCEPDTLAFDYENFTSDFIILPFVSEDVHKDECEEETSFCTALHITHKGTQWTREESADAGDSAETDVTWDEAKGLERFVSSFSGGVNRVVEVTLKP